MRVVYVSYDGALDPLGSSQVVPYLIGLARGGVGITLVSFEKAERRRSPKAWTDLRERLQACGIRWTPLAYHKHPRLPATLWDVLAGGRAIGRELRISQARLVHCRGDVAMVMARAARLPRATRLLYDVRAFFSDERVESGSWRRGGPLDQIVRWMEIRNLRRADGIVVLTEAARSELSARCPSLRPLRVIPTCVDLTVFTPRRPGDSPDHGLVYSGSLGTSYMARELVAFARVASKAIPGRTLFLTPQVEEARRAGVTPDWAELRTVSPGDVPAWLRRARALFFIRPTLAKRASCPTKVAEALASGLPVVANRGVGDLDDFLECAGVGVLLEGFSQEAYLRAAERLRRLLEDDNTAARCRRFAEARFSLESGVAAYHELYRALSL